MTQTILASSEVTLVDLNDARQLAVFLNATQPKVQIYDPNTAQYTPDWSGVGSNNVITPSLYVAGTNTDIISSAKSVNWSVNGAAINPASPPAGYAVGNTSPWALTISSNVLSGQNSISIICTVVWTDTYSGLDVNAQAEIDFTKAQNGITAITGILSNDSATVPTDSSGGNGIFTGAVSTMSVYIGATDDSANWSFSQNAVNVVGTASNSNRTFTTTSFASGQTAGYVDFTATKGGNSITKRFTINASMGGTAGNDATSYWVIVSAPAVTLQKNNNNAYNPGTIKVTGMSQTGNGSPGQYSCRFVIDESKDSGANWTNKYTSVSNEATYTYTPSAYNATTNAVNQIRISMYAAGGTVNLLDQQITPIVSDGVNAITAVLNNETQALAANNDGTVPSYTSAVTTMTVYVGATDDTANWTYGASPSNVTGAFSGTNHNIYSVTNLSQDTGYVDITATKGTSTITKRFNLHKTYNSVAYNLISPSVIRKSGTTYSPATVALSATQQTGQGAPTAYSGRFKIEESTDSGQTYTTKYTSATDESSYTYTPTAVPALPAAPINLVKVSLYKNGGTTNLLDQQSIHIVTDGTNGSNAVTAFCWTPNGNTIRNSSGNVVAECDVYVGGTKQDPSTVQYQWYYLSAGTWTACTSSYTGYNTYQLTVTPTQINGQAYFQCWATYGGTTYKDVVSMSDLTDPIVISLISDTGTVFKNGQGTKNYTCKVYRNGSEIDTDGSGYQYRWYLTNEDGTPYTDASWVDAGQTYKSGKNIAVGNSNVTNLANLQCELWTKS